MAVKENQNTEWKSVWKDEYLAWICDFANAQGGKLYIGVDNKGKPVGLKDSRRLLEDLPNKISNATGITVNINLHDMVFLDRNTRFKFNRDEANER